MKNTLKDTMMVVIGLFLLIIITIIGIPFAMLDGLMSFLKDVWVKAYNDFWKEFKRANT